MLFYHYCPKCGNITLPPENNKKCNYCGEECLPTHISFSDSLHHDWEKEPNYDPDKIILEEYVKPNPLFDEELYNKRIALEKKQEEATSNRLRMEKRQAQRANVPKCPTCGSTNVERISTAQKAFGFALVGLFSSNLGKTMHCRNCGYKW